MELLLLKFWMRPQSREQYKRYQPSPDPKEREHHLSSPVKELLWRELVMLCVMTPSPPFPVVVEGQRSSLTFGGWATWGSLGAPGMCLLGSGFHKHRSLSLPKRSSKVEFCVWRCPRGTAQYKEQHQKQITLLPVVGQNNVSWVPARELWS